jgi:hypothetical protein
MTKYFDQLINIKFQKIKKFGSNSIFLTTYYMETCKTMPFWGMWISFEILWI